MAPKKKKGGDDGAAGGKEKPAAPTELEREELRVKITALEDRLQRTQQKLEAANTDHAETRQLLEKQQADQADIVDYLKKEIEKKTAENVALEKKYILLREAKENEEGRLCEALEGARLDSEATREVGEAQKHECARLESRLDEYEALKVLKVQNQEHIGSLDEELATCKVHLEMARSQLEICAAAEGDDVGLDGSFAVPLMLLESMRIYASKPILCEQACAALQSLLSGDRKEDCAIVRKNGGVLLLLDVMRQHVDEAGLQSAACGLLWKLAFTDPQTRKIVVKKEGITLILQAMQSHLDHPRLQYNACGALRNLLVDGSRDFSVASQISPGGRELAPVEAPGRGRGGRGRLGAGGRAPSPNRPPPGGKRMHNVRSLPTLKPVAGGRSARAVDDDPAARARSATSPTPPGRNERQPDVTAATRQTVAEQGLSLTLRSMGEHLDQPLVQEYGCGTLWNLMMATPEIKQRVAEEDGVRTVLAAMRAHPMGAGVQLNACAALQEMSQYPMTLEHMKKLQARTQLEAAVANHPHNQDLLNTAERTIQFLPAL